MKDPQQFDMSVILTGSSKGVISVNLFGTLPLGKVQLFPPSQVLSISSVKNQSHHMVLTQDNEFKYLIPLTVSFINKYGLYLIDVTSIPVKISALLEYIKDTLDLVQVEMKGMSTANREFLTSLSSAIELDQSSGTYFKGKFPDYRPNTEIPMIQQVALKTESALLDSLLTGIANRGIEYWLKELLKEKGIKKWRKLCFNSFDNVRKILFENLLPACERMILLLTELRGLAKWSERGIPLGLDIEHLDSCVENVQSMAKMANNLIWSLNSQFALFRYFSSWVEILFEEVTGIPLKDPAFDSQGPKYTVSSKVVEYITKHIGASMNLPEALDLQQSSANLDSTCDNLKDICELVFDKVKKKMLEHISGGTALKLISSQNNSQVKIHLVGTGSEQSCYVAIYDTSYPLEMTFARFKMSESNPIKAVEISRLDANPGPGYASIDKFEFANNSDMATLISTEDKSKKLLLSFSFSELLYTSVQYETGKTLTELAQPVASGPLEIKRSREFGETFIPEHFTINDERHVGCLLERDLQQYIFFDTNEDEDEDEDENEDGDEDAGGDKDEDGEGDDEEEKE